MATQRKIDTVAALTDKVGKAKVMVLADYRGLKHKQLEELRRNLKKTNGEFMIAKNRLILRALGERADSIREPLNNETAVLFAYQDEVAPLKEMLKFFKAAGVGKPKAGLMGAVVMNESDIAKLATLPSREVLLGKLVGQLNAPIQGLHYALQWNMNKLVWALNAIKGKKTS
ncbi:MAG: 50S ribosomal protein L10 [Patescibacteria group bacterium]